MSESSEIVLNFHDSLLRKSDVDLLDEGHWLNDELIGFALEYFERVQFVKSKDTVGFIGPGMTQLIKFLEGDDLKNCLSSLELAMKQHIFLPINDNDSEDTAGGSHWSLLYYNRELGHFIHYDSCSNCNNPVAKSVAKRLYPCLQSDKPFEFINGECPQQTNGCDCGVYVLSITEHLTKQLVDGSTIPLKSAVTPQSVQQKRSDLRQLIHSLAAS